MNEDPQPQHLIRWDVTSDDIPAPVLVGPACDRVYLLPDKMIDGIAVYRDDVAGLVKTLRHEGVDVEFAYPREARRYLSEYSSTPPLIMIAISVSSSLTTALIQHIAKIAWARARSAMGGSLATAEVGAAQVTVNRRDRAHSRRDSLAGRRGDRRCQGSGGTPAASDHRPAAGRPRAA